MDILQYQKKARETAVYPSDSQLLYPVLGLSSEAGEVCGKLKKQIRDKEGILDDPEFLEGIGKELGDCLWYLANIAFDLGLDLDKIAKDNIKKLEDRQNRGVLRGSGDTR